MILRRTHKGFRVRDAVRVKAMESEDIEVLTDAVISPIEVEVLVSDRLTDEPVIVIERAGEGLWKLEMKTLKEKVKD